jgi:hypothetical protein
LLLAPARDVFRAVATTVVPEATRLDASGWRELEGIVERFLDQRPAAIRRQLRLFLNVVQWLPVARFGRPFTALDPSLRGPFLAALQDARWLLVRRGFWGLRTLVLLGYYGRAGAGTEIGYHAGARGWAARR